MKKELKASVRIGLFFIGINILAIGVCILLKSNLGVSSWDAVALGISNLFHVSIGVATFFVSILVTFICFMLSRKVTSFLSVITGFCLGMLIDLWNSLVFTHIVITYKPLIYILFLFGILLMGLGVAIYIYSDFPISHVDLFMKTVADKFQLSLKVSKWITEGIALVVSFLLLHKIEIGTIIILFLYGLAIDFFAKQVEKVVANDIFVKDERAI